MLESPLSVANQLRHSLDIMIYPGALVLLVGVSTALAAPTALAAAKADRAVSLGDL